ncbi:Acetyltransferase (GNAT) domain-containing protein [Consotaella salsifontis]|uniref:Acetyltransferase (GNAT) domain-containing protein n=1 Tax=Consotaella salsifontis TaxID=1365950 RepID=A0A1T4LCZ0_9HYPH|nr:Acetyltransferase (GNAT) domain-containing protein [Consotaella salsifontis]
MIPVTLIKAIVTQLIIYPPARPLLPWPDDGRVYALVRAPNIPVGFYRYLYDTVGKAHHWTSRHLPDARLAQEIHSPSIGIHVLYVDGAPAGWFETEHKVQLRETRIVHFAVLPDFHGQKLARPLLTRAIEAGLSTGCEVLSLETNTLDHPAALRLYRTSGFEAVGVREVLTAAIEPR